MQPLITNKYNIHHVESTRNRLYLDLQSHRSHRLRIYHPLQRGRRTSQTFRSSQILPSQKDQKHIKERIRNQRPIDANPSHLPFLNQTPQPPTRSPHRSPWLQAWIPAIDSQGTHQLGGRLKVWWNADLPSSDFGSGGQSEWNGWT